MKNSKLRSRPGDNQEDQIIELLNRFRTDFHRLYENRGNSLQRIYGAKPAEELNPPSKEMMRRRPNCPYNHTKQKYRDRLERLLALKSVDVITVEEFLYDFLGKYTDAKSMKRDTESIRHNVISLLKDILSTANTGSTSSSIRQVSSESGRKTTALTRCELTLLFVTLSGFVYAIYVKFMSTSSTEVDLLSSGNSEEERGISKQISNYFPFLEDNDTYQNSNTTDFFHSSISNDTRINSSSTLEITGNILPASALETPIIINTIRILSQELKGTLSCGALGMMVRYLPTTKEVQQPHGKPPELASHDDDELSALLSQLNRDTLCPIGGGVGGGGNYDNDIASLQEALKTREQVQEQLVQRDDLAGTDVMDMFKELGNLMERVVVNELYEALHKEIDNANQRSSIPAYEPLNEKSSIIEDLLKRGSELAEVVDDPEGHDVASKLKPSIIKIYEDFKSYLVDDAEKAIADLVHDDSANFYVVGLWATIETLIRYSRVLNLGGVTVAFCLNFFPRLTEVYNSIIVGNTLDKFNDKLAFAIASAISKYILDKHEDTDDFWTGTDDDNRKKIQEDRKKIEETAKHSIKLIENISMNCLSLFLGQYLVAGTIVRIAHMGKIGVMIKSTASFKQLEPLIETAAWSNDNFKQAFSHSLRAAGLFAVSHTASESTSTPLPEVEIVDHPGGDDGSTRAIKIKTGNGSTDDLPTQPATTPEAIQMITDLQGLTEEKISSMPMDEWKIKADKYQVIVENMKIGRPFRIKMTGSNPHGYIVFDEEGVMTASYTGLRVRQSLKAAAIALSSIYSKKSSPTEALRIFINEQIMVCGAFTYFEHEYNNAIIKIGDKFKKFRDVKVRERVKSFLDTASDIVAAAKPRPVFSSSAIEIGAEHDKHDDVDARKVLEFLFNTKDELTIEAVLFMIVNVYNVDISGNGDDLQLVKKIVEGIHTFVNEPTIKFDWKSFDTTPRLIPVSVHPDQLNLGGSTLFKQQPSVNRILEVITNFQAIMLDHRG